MSAKNRPVSKPMSKQFEENYDRIFRKDKPAGEPADLKEPSNLGHKHWSPSVSVENWDCMDDDCVDPACPRHYAGDVK